MTFRMQQASDIFEYSQSARSEFILGTKAGLQQLGLGTGTPYPGEVGGPKRVLRITDPRGYAGKIEKTTTRDEDGYFAVIWYPWVPDSYWKEQHIEFAPGVKLSKYPYFDRYIGNDVDLVAAGLTPAACLPGSPGMAKSVVNLGADGLPIRKKSIFVEGNRTISRAGKRRFSIDVYLPKDERVRRDAAFDLAVAEGRAAMAKIPRPPKLLTPSRAAEVANRRASIRLAWSKPALQGMFK
jgi:hypothetical protein